MAISRKTVAAAVALCALLCALAGAATASADPVNTQVPTVTMDPGGGVNFDITGAIPGHDVNVYLDGVGRWTYTADSSGNVTNAGPGGVAPGQHTLAATSVDGNHVESARSTPVSFLLRPNRPRFAELVIGVQVNQSQPPVKLTGLDPTASQVTLYENRIIGGMWTPVEIGAGTTIGSDGTASVTPNAPLADGPHTLIPSQTVNGYESDVDPAPHIQVRFHAAAPSLDDPADGTLSNNGQPSFSVSDALSTSAGGNANVRVVLDENQPNWTIANGRSDEHGHATLSLGYVGQGPHTAYAITIDDLGHEGARSTLVHFTVDQTPPTAPTVVTPQDGSTTTTSTPQVTAHSEPGARVHLLIDGFIDQGVRTADASGNVTFTVSQALSLGQHGLMVFAVDVAGNIGATTLTTFTVSDSTQPTEPTNPVQPTDPAKPTDPPKSTTLATPSQVKLSSRVLTKRKPVNVAFTLSTPGTVQLQLTRTVHGKARTVTTATIKVGHAGKVTYTLRTGVGKHKLTAGAYNLTLVTVSGDDRSVTVSQKLTVR